MAGYFLSEGEEDIEWNVKYKPAVERKAGKNEI